MNVSIKSEYFQHFMVLVRHVLSSVKPTWCPLNSYYNLPETTPEVWIVRIGWWPGDKLMYQINITWFGLYARL